MDTLGLAQGVLMLQRLSQAQPARDSERLSLIERRQLHGSGMGYVDAHLLASAMLTPDTRL